MSPFCMNEILRFVYVFLITMAGGSCATRKQRRRTKRLASGKLKVSVNSFYQKPNFSGFSQRLIDLDACQLIEIGGAEESYCDVCANITQEKVSSKYSCGACNVICCPECYDFHHREQMSRALRMLQKNIPENMKILVSEDAELYTCGPGEDGRRVKVVASGSKSNCLSHETDVAIKELKKQFNARIEVNITKDNSCIYFQDKQMEEFFDYYPEYILIDVTCEIVELELTLYNFICEDANGHCEIICGCLLKSEEKEVVQWMCDTFKKHNPSWSKVKVILLDNAVQSTDVFKKSFPNTMVSVSIFHTLQMFKSDLAQLDVEKKEKISAIKLFENMVAAVNESEYNQLHKEFDQFSPALIAHFENKWNKRRGTWALSMKLGCKVFLSPMSKFLCQFQRRMKGSLITQTKLEKVIKTFFVKLLLYRIEHYRNISAVFQSARVAVNLKSPHQKYAKFLTNYGGKLVLHQLTIAPDVKNIRKVSPGKYRVGSLVDSLSVTTTTCSCSFSTCTALPCAHVFAIRRSLSLPMFWEALCAARWVAKNYQSTFLALHAVFTRKHMLHMGEYISESDFEKYFEVAGQLVPLLTQSADEATVKRLRILSHILEAWKQGIKVSIKCTENSETKVLKLDPDCSIDHLKNLYGISADERFDSGEFSSVSLYSEDSSDELLKCLKDQDQLNSNGS